MREETKILKALLESHALKDIKVQEDWLLPNGRLPALRAYWNPKASENVGQLNIEILYDLNRPTIIEQFGGYGDESEQLYKAFDNFTLNSFHELLAFFWGIGRENITIKNWQIGDEEYEVYIGKHVTTSFGGKEVKSPQNYDLVIKNLITQEPLHNKIHWFGFYYSNPYGYISSSKDNQAWQKGVEMLKSLDWEKRDDFYALRQFFILRRVREDFPQQWESYFSQRNNRPAFTRTNLALKDIFPLEGYNKRGVFSLFFQNPQDNGLPDSSEYETINDIEDEIEIIIESFGGIYSGIITTNGGYDMIFYLKDDSGIEKEINRVMQSYFKEYQYDFSIKEERNFETYFNILYPSKYEYQSILNQKVLRELEQEGDIPTKPREVDHYILAFGEPSKENIIKELKNLGFIMSPFVKTT